MKNNLIRVVYVNRGHASTLMLPHDERLRAMQALVGGLIERVMDFHLGNDGSRGDVDIFANDEALFLWPDQESEIEPISEVQILGPYFYVGCDGKGQSISLNDAQINLILSAHGL